ncbi:MAG: hypothetical protein K2R98_26655 [Gemmataceae bacterium]|nr:hypothetical protein [Gemmataceae bacterium]
MNAILVNLLLAIFWIFLGVGLLLHEVVTERRMFKLPLGNLNPGWLAILFGAYNCYRVWWIWSYQRRRRTEQVEDNALRRRMDRGHEPRIQEPPNPDFMFDKPPSENIQAPGPIAERPRSDPPPSAS